MPFDRADVAWTVAGHHHPCPPWDQLATGRRGDHAAAACWPPSPDRAPNPLPTPLFAVLADIAAGRTTAALATARAAYLAQPDSAIAIVALGEAYEAAGAPALAARAYASLIDQPAPSAAWWRVTAQRLDRLGAPARAQAIATYRAALAIAPDHVGARRRLALDLLQAGDGPGALAALVAARAAARADAARALVEEKDHVRDIEQTLQRSHLERLKEGRTESIETSNIHQETLRALKQVNTAFTQVAYPILSETGDLLASRLSGSKMH